MTLPISPTWRITIIVFPIMPNTWSNMYALVILTAILRHKRLFNYFLTLYRVLIAIPPKKDMVAGGGSKDLGT